MDLRYIAYNSRSHTYRVARILDNRCRTQSNGLRLEQQQGVDRDDCDNSSDHNGEQPSPVGSLGRLDEIVQAYTAALVATTQQLALRRNLLLQQTVTATHDKAHAWSGLGSALISLKNQFHIAASVWGTIAVAVYLSCITLLHVTTPAIFTLEVFNLYGGTRVATTLGLPIIQLNESQVNSCIQDVPLMSSPVPQIHRLDSGLTERRCFLSYPALLRMRPWASPMQHCMMCSQGPRTALGR